MPVEYPDDPNDPDFPWRTKPEFTHDERGRVTPLPPDPDIGLLDICVARVIDVTKHPRSPRIMYVETLDTGRYSRKRKAASLFAHCYEPSQLVGRLVLTVLNVRPMIQRELVKRFLVMCAQNRNNGRFELLDPPAGSVAGDSVVVEGFRREPAIVISLGTYERKATRHYFLPYKKGKDGYHYDEFDETKAMFDSTAAELWVNEDGVAEFMGVPLQVDGKGVVTAKTLRDCPIVFE